MSSVEEPITLPERQADEGKRDDSIVITQATLYVIVALIFGFVAGFGMAWITFSTTSMPVTAEDLKSAAAAGARDAVRAEMQALQASLGQGSEARTQPQVTAEPPTPVRVELGDSPAWGPEDARVTIVEFSDFQCSFCRRFQQETLPLIRAEYGDKVRFVYKHYAFLTPDSKPAAVASVCAHEQGRFWEYHDLLFSDLTRRSREALVKFAVDSGVPDTERFTQCLDAEQPAAAVQADIAQGMGFGVSGTPTFFINGLPLVGAQPYSIFKQVIDQTLAAVN